MILKQNLDVLVPKDTGTISFVFHFLEQIQRADCGTIAFGSRVDVINSRRPRLPKTWSRNTSSVTLKGHSKSRIRANSKMFCPNASNNEWIRFDENKIWGVRCTFCFDKRANCHTLSVQVRKLEQSRATEKETWQKFAIFLSEKVAILLLF